MINNTSQSIDIDAKVHVFRYGTKGIPNDIWLPQMIKLDYEKVIPVHLSILPNGYVNTSVSVDDIKDLEDMPLCLILESTGVDWVQVLPIA